MYLLVFQLKEKLTLTYDYIIIITMSLFVLIRFVLSDLFDLALTVSQSCSGVFAVYKKVCIQMSNRTSSFIKRFVH